MSNSKPVESFSMDDLYASPVYAKNLIGEINSYQPLNVMAGALNRPCPKPDTNLPEPKHCGYRESVRGGVLHLYEHEMFAMGCALKEKRFIDKDINTTKAMWLRSAARGYLIREFWRFLGAA